MSKVRKVDLIILYLYIKQYTVMKKVLFTLLSIQLMVLTGCSQLFYDSYQRYDDEFKNNTRIISRVLLAPEERRNDISYAYIIFERVISGTGDITKAYFVITRNTSSFRIENQGYLKADNRSFELTITNPVTEYKSKNETSVSSFAKVDSTGVSTGQTTDISENKWIEDKFIITLTPEMISAIKAGDNLLLRFYFGPLPATFIINRKMKPIHRMLNE
jgi:hypothetical protein